VILAKTPFRISFLGGGSDLPGFYRSHPGAVVSTTINKFMYIAIHPYFHNRIRVKYSQTEDADSVDQIRHPLVRECLNFQKIERGMEIASFADVPAGTGMGSSSAFTVCLLQALHALREQTIAPRQLAEEACFIELDRVGDRIGKQDQYAAAYGGLNYIRFNSDETVEVEPVPCSRKTREELLQHLLLFYVGQERRASAILEEQSRNMADREKFLSVKRMSELAAQFRAALVEGNLSACGELLHRGWLLKSSLASGITNPVIERYYSLAREAGATGGKLLGAGGGGFLLVFCARAQQSEVREALGELTELAFGMEEAGSSVIYNDGLNTSNVVQNEVLKTHS
jgi:D-glycero-alpha-D-manno-heptose-7-phosphate kinase